ncbi:MAG: hypothetical protein IAE97_07435 [Chthoniobacterales bacterium]|nr:hypothetical protein [Chthoniobacterales bacterium]
MINPFQPAMSVQLRTIAASAAFLILALPAWADPFDSANPRSTVEDVLKMEPEPQGTLHALVRGRLLGVTGLKMTEGSVSRYKMWLTTMGANPSVHVREGTDEKVPPPEELQAWIGKEIEVSVNVQKWDDAGFSLHRWRDGHEPRLAGQESGDKPTADIHPLAIFADLPRVSVKELRKKDISKDFGAFSGHPVLIIGKLYSVVGEGLSTRNFWMTQNSGKGSVSFSMDPGRDADEIKKLVGKEIAILAGNVGKLPSELRSAVEFDISAENFLDQGRVRPAVFLSADIPAAGAPSVPQHKVLPAAPAGSTANLQPARNIPRQVSSQQTGTLLAPLRVELKHNGKAVGSTTLQPGTSLPIVKSDGARALVKHAGGESWVQAASEWDVTQIADLTADLSGGRELMASVKASLVITNDEPRVAWITPSGLFFAERKANQWEVEKIDGWNLDPEGERRVNCQLYLDSDGKPHIAYTSSESPGFLKYAVRGSNGWSIDTVFRADSYGKNGTAGARLAVGEWKGAIAIASWNAPRASRGEPSLWTSVDESWVEQDLDAESRGGIRTIPRDVLFSRGNALDLLGLSWLDKKVGEGGDTKWWPSFGQSDGQKWVDQKIQAPQQQDVAPHFLASHGEQVYASFSTAFNNCLNLARRSGASWEIMSLDPAKLLDMASEGAPKWSWLIWDSLPFLGGRRDALLAGMDAFAENRIGLLMANGVGDSEGEHAVYYGDVIFPSRCLSEKVAAGFPCAFAFDEGATPHIVFVNAGELCLATRKSAAQIAAGKQEGAGLRLPEAVQNVRPATAKVLPEKIRPGSELERMQRIAALGEPQKFTLPVAGENAQFIRWGSGDKAIVFFTQTPKWTETRSVGRDGEKKGFVKRFNESPSAIASQIDAYAPWLENGYSVIAWDYPRDPQRDNRKEGEIDEAQLHPDHSGAAKSMIEALREKAGLTELILIGNTDGAELLLWDLAALEGDQEAKVILVAPKFHHLPDISKLPDQAKAVIIDNTDSMYYTQHHPEAGAWVKAHRSDATDTLAPGGGHPAVGADIGHETFAQWLLNSK